MIFEWDPRKARTNFQKHGVTFTEAATIFVDPLAVSFPDPDSNPEEERFVTFGVSDMQRLLVVAHVDTGLVTRIISARTVTRAERSIYEEA